MVEVSWVRLVVRGSGEETPVPYKSRGFGRETRVFELQIRSIDDQGEIKRETAATHHMPVTRWASDRLADLFVPFAMRKNGGEGGWERDTESFRPKRRTSFLLMSIPISMKPEVFGISVKT